MILTISLIKGILLWGCAKGIVLAGFISIYSKVNVRHEITSIINDKKLTTRYSQYIPL